jgi:peptidoglycan/LPS O-acetylase OafA/YrhL
MSTPKQNARIVEVDGLRGLAILLVFLFHYFKNSVVGHSVGLSIALAPLRLSWSGVDLFFVISGYLIAGNLFSFKESANYYRTFYLRRFCRILPLYYLWLLIFVILLPLAPNALTGTFNVSIPLWSYVAFCQNILMTIRKTLGSQWLFITWSLAVEEQFYLILPILIRRTTRRALVALLLFALISAPVTRVLFLMRGYAAGSLAILICRADALSLGVLIALMAPYHNRIRQRRPLFYLSFAILWLGTIYFAFGRYGVPIIAIRGTWLALFYANILILSIVSPGPIERLVFGNRLLIRLGTISYAVYLFHEGIRCLLHWLFLGSTAEVYDWYTFCITLLSAVITIILAELSWRYFERPILRFSHAAYKY